MPTVDAEVLEAKVKQMYRLVVEQPHGVYHFAKRAGCCDRVADWRSPTSSASGS
jgi:hypothetical protein